MSSEIVEKLPGVTAFTKANIYFDGKVISHSLEQGDGSKVTLGMIFPGTYHFNTGLAEKMEIVSGSCQVQIDGESEISEYPQGSSFLIPGNSGFNIAVASGITEYICSFLQ